MCIKKIISLREEHRNTRKHKEKTPKTSHSCELWMNLTCKTTWLTRLTAPSCEWIDLSRTGTWNSCARLLQVQEGEAGRVTQCKKKKKKKKDRNIKKDKIKMCRQEGEQTVRVRLGVCACWGERRGREGKRGSARLYMDVQIRGCVHILHLFSPECFCTEEKRIWQSCLLSPQNNCLWITWSESHWRYLEMTLRGDSLNHVHIRPAQEFDFTFPPARVKSLCSSSACVSLQITADVSASVNLLAENARKSQIFPTVYCTRLFHITHLWQLNYVQ